MYINLDKVKKITAEQSGSKSKYYLTFEFDDRQKEVKYFDTVEDLETWVTDNLPENFILI